MIDPAFDLRSWRKLFKSPSEIVVKQLRFIVDNFIPPGITFLGGPPGHGKSWTGLSLAKAIWSGQPFLGYSKFACPHAIPILYLSPEVNSTAFKSRLEKLGLAHLGPNDGFLCRTLTDGICVPLHDPNLREVVKDLRPVVFLDTMTRFNTAEDENNSTQVGHAVANYLFELQAKGAQAIIPLHHSTKELMRLDVTPTLENVLRGTGDFAAMADAVHCVRSTDVPNFIAEITCVKSRDFDHEEPFEFQGRPFIDDEGDLKMTRPPNMDPEEYRTTRVHKLGEYLRDNPRATHRDAARACGISRGSISGYASDAGLVQKNKIWVECPRN